MSEADATTPLWPFPPRAQFGSVHPFAHDGSSGATTLAEWFDNNSLPYEYDHLLAPSESGIVLPNGTALPAGAALRVRRAERVVRVYDVEVPEVSWSEN